MVVRNVGINPSRAQRVREIGVGRVRIRAREDIGAPQRSRAKLLSEHTQELRMDLVPGRVELGRLVALHVEEVPVGIEDPVVRLRLLLVRHGARAQERRGRVVLAIRVGES